MAFSTLVDYWVGKQLQEKQVAYQRKTLLAISLSVNLGLLAYFKYANFFIESFSAAFSFFGAPIQPRGLSIILPVGISFYTFQTLSYSIDVYSRHLKPSDDLIAFAAYVSFFPQLVAGPIERAKSLLPQFQTIRRFDYAKAVLGCRQILWGLFKKMVVADNCAVWVDLFYNNSESYGGALLFLATCLFAIQIYCDFSGYSDIAIGVARLFGFNLMQNFAFPYFSRNIGEFWRRWHISLSTWFRDYLYIPLGGSRGSINKSIRNVFIIFLVSGLWHGASWNFVLWGGIHALLFIPLLGLKLNRRFMDKPLSEHGAIAKEVLFIALTFICVCLAWVPFRAVSLEQCFDIYSKLFTPQFQQLFSIPQKSQLVVLLFFSLFM
ncbi:MAG: MBOAT family O-acyltransferase, partial [Luteibaculum sp.]